MKKVFAIDVPDELTRNGFESVATPDDWREKYIAALRFVIRGWLEKTAKVSTNPFAYSYKLKHIMERILGVYCSNGDLILAMIAEGYDYRRDGINAYFNVCPASVKELAQKSSGKRHVGQNDETVAAINLF